MLEHDRDCCGPARGTVASRTSTASAERVPLIEILYFDGCPNHHPALALVERICHELGIEPDLRLVNVPDQEAAQRMRFRGSPTVCVNGRDVDPSTENRNDYALACRVFRTNAGMVGQPDERWIRAALLEAR